MWLDRKVFVTGGTGLVGSWLVDALVERGADVIVLVRDWVPRSRLLNKNHKHVTLVRGDLSCPDFLERVLALPVIVKTKPFSYYDLLAIATEWITSPIESRVLLGAIVKREQLANEYKRRAQRSGYRKMAAYLTTLEHQGSCIATV